MDLARHLLFENPLSLWIALGLVAVVAVGVWTRTRSEKALWAAAGCVLAGLALAVLALAAALPVRRRRRPALHHPLDRHSQRVSGASARWFILGGISIIQTGHGRKCNERS